jgi:site-specific DNA recombinase
MKRAIIYARVSTTRQADDGVSIDAQIEQCHKKAAEMDAAVLQVFRDDGITGTSALKRHAFQRAINFCAYNDVDYFIVWSTSRAAQRVKIKT